MNLNKTLILEKEIESANQLSEVVQFLKPLLQEKTCILLHGDLAAGKTTFVSAFCKLFSLQAVASPTFALHHVYSNSDISIDHFDLYRLKDDSEIETAGLWEVFAKAKSLIFIEWPERINVQDIPLDYKIFSVEIKKLSETARRISLFSLN